MPKNRIVQLFSPKHLLFIFAFVFLSFVKQTCTRSCILGVSGGFLSAPRTPSVSGFTAVGPSLLEYIMTVSVELIPTLSHYRVRFLCDVTFLS